jgi:hypothetical protein
MHPSEYISGPGQPKPHDWVEDGGGMCTHGQQPDTLQGPLYVYSRVVYCHRADPVSVCAHGRTGFEAGCGKAGCGRTWPYMYGMPVLLLMMITLLNDGALITIGYDDVIGSAKPCVWNIKMLFLVSFVMAAVACVSSLLLLHFALESWQEESTFRMLGLEPMSWGHITTLLYLFALYRLLSPIGW